MKVPILIFLALCIAHGNSQGLLGLGNIANDALNLVGGVVKNLIPINRPISHRKTYRDFKQSQKTIYTNLYERIASQTDNHFVFSPNTIWLTLSALAEGADPSVQAQLFTALLLPQEAELRKKLYEMALNVEQSGPDVSLLRNRQLVLDQSLVVKPPWQNLMRTMGLLDVSFAPIKTDPEGTSQQLREMISARSDIVLSGNSILLESLDYQGLWTTAFPAESVRPEPFYDDRGQQIGVVNMMRMKKRVRLAHLPFMKAKALELPVGADGRYKMLITMGLGNDFFKNAIQFLLAAIMHIFSFLTMSLVPIEIAVPQFAMTSEFDTRTILTDGLDVFFNKPEATSDVSHPPALPGSWIQRATINVGPNGVNPLPERNVTGPISGLLNVASNTATGLVAAVGRDFIANKPFLFGLFDTKTDACLFAGAYTHPQ